MHFLRVRCTNAASQDAKKNKKIISFLSATTFDRSRHAPDGSDSDAKNIQNAGTIDQDDAVTSPTRFDEPGRSPDLWSPRVRDGCGALNSRRRFKSYAATARIAFQIQPMKNPPEAEIRAGSLEEVNTKPCSRASRVNANTGFCSALPGIFRRLLIGAVV